MKTEISPLERNEKDSELQRRNSAEKAELSGEKVPFRRRKREEK